MRKSADFRRAWLPASSVALSFGSLVCPSARGALVLTGDTPQTETFDAFDGTAATVPANFTAGTPFTFGSPGRTLTSGTTPYNSTTGWYALNDNDSPADVAIGGRTNASNGSGTLTWEITNGTGATIPGLSLTFDVEQYSGSASGNRLDVLWNTAATGTFVTANLTGDTQTAIPNASPTDTTFANPTVQAGREVQLNQPIADGETVYLRFFWNPVSGGSRPHFGVDNATVAPLPEPGAAGVLGILGMGLLARRRHVDRCPSLQAARRE